MKRLSDNDKYFGPVTIASWFKQLGIRFSSGSEPSDGFSRNYILITAFRTAVRIELPRILSPYCDKYGSAEREYGISIDSNGGGEYDYINIRYGPQTYDSLTTKRLGWFIPWKQWRMVRMTFFNPDQTVFYTCDGHDFFTYYPEKEKCPSTQYLIKDYDGEEIVATVRVEEREWKRGEKWFKWVGWFYKPQVRRSLDISFDKEVGPEKGSWKGGTLGHGMEMKAGETIDEAFDRYCKTSLFGRGIDRRRPIELLRKI